MTLKPGRHAQGLVFEVEHIGLDMDFYHPKGRKLGLAPETVEQFERDREHGEIFIQNASGTAYSTEEMLSWFLLQTGTTLADNLPGEKLQDPPGHLFVTFPIRFEQGTFHMLTEDGPQDLSGLRVMTKVSFRRQDA